MTQDQVEQDLVLSRVLVEIAADPDLANELVFRGGTCLHKIHLPAPLRYSEDLDYVRSSNTPIGSVLDALRGIGNEMGFRTQTKVGEHPKVFFKGQFESGASMRIKVEINTHETSPAKGPIHRRHSVASAWWTGGADVLTFTPEELVATKLRALHQRRKGRDLFDLWLALTDMQLDPSSIVSCFGPYRPDGYTRAAALRTLDEHLGHSGFRSDLDQLVVATPAGYSIDAAGRLIRDQLLALV